MAQRLHFSGIGGTAMLAGARLAIEAGFEVRGSDGILYPPASTMVAQLGVPVYTGYDAKNLDWAPDQVIIGNALSRGNPEVEFVLSKNLPYISLPEWLKTHVLRNRQSIVISGTHGKTTTSALTAHVIQQRFPKSGYLIGGEALGFKHSSALGEEGAPFVIEGDEYDTAFFDKRAKFLHYLPDIAVVTSLEFDHGDIYRDLAEIETAFQRMFRQIPAEGLVLLCKDNHAASLASHAFSQVESYGFSPDADWSAVYTDLHGVQGLHIQYKGTDWGTVPLSLAGKHNHQNTLAAVAIAATVGMTQSDITEAVASFPGVRRRMEVFLRHDGMVFVDDFAHHPTAIGGTLEAARNRWPKKRIVAVIEPRSNTMVTNQFQNDLLTALDQADVVFFGPIHRGESIPVEKRLNRAALASSLAKEEKECHVFDEVQALFASLITTLRPDDLVLFMSNGAFGGIYRLLTEHFGA